MNTLTRAALIAASLAALPVLAIAQNMPMQHDNMPMGQGNMGQGNMGQGGMMMDHSAHMGGAANTPATKAFEDANARMHKDMAITYSGNADVDFARGMIPHHQGAIDMAKIELEYGKDPELKKLAEEIIKAQESEIAFLKAWLAKNAK